MALTKRQLARFFVPSSKIILTDDDGTRRNIARNASRIPIELGYFVDVENRHGDRLLATRLFAQKFPGYLLTDEHYLLSHWRVNDRRVFPFKIIPYTNSEKTMKAHADKALYQAVIDEVNSPLLAKCGDVDDRTERGRNQS